MGDDVAGNRFEPTDPYARRQEAVKEPPVGFWPTLRHLGPGLILVGSVVGSGEIVLTTTLGAKVGFAMLWWILLSCWGKNIVQAELGRHTISSGESSLQAFNQLPGPRWRGSWFIWLWVLALIPYYLAVGGIYGASGQALNLLLPASEFGAWWTGDRIWTIILAALAAGLILSGTYRLLERMMTIMVVVFTFVTVSFAILVGWTDFAFSWPDIKSGFRLSFPGIAVASALAAYGATGVSWIENLAYPYWCVEKGYARFAGRPDGSNDWVQRARGWIRVMHMDVVLTMFILTIATFAFYSLGAAVLHAGAGQGTDPLVPGGFQTVEILSETYSPFGDWAPRLFQLGALCVLYSTVLSGLGGMARMQADCIGILGFIDTRDYSARLRWERVFAVVSPCLFALFYFFIQRPVWMLTVGASIGAAMMPIVTAGTIFLRYKRTDRRIAPTWKSDAVLWLCFGTMLALAAYTIYAWISSPETMTAK